MILKKIQIQGFRGINQTITILFDSFNCIVGQNDAGKSTILKAIDTVLNENTLTIADYNVHSVTNQIVIELYFDCQQKNCLIGEEIMTTVEAEELVDEDNYLVWKKVWTINGTNISKPKSLFMRKLYEGKNDFVLKTETQLMTQCSEKQIETSKGNGEAYNNVEKRQKLRMYNHENNIPFSFIFEEVPSTGSTKVKAIGDSIKKLLPTFQYFKADTSLSDTDTTIQKYFKDLAFKLIDDEINTDEIEKQIKEQLGAVLKSISDKINEVVKSEEKVRPNVDFDWSKIVSTSFVSALSDKSIPLSSRGDGFRRITMMSYFEYLAETKRGSSERNIIFGFEEPETFLHPTAQDNLYDKLNNMTANGYQVISSTHSPTIVGKTNIENIIHVEKINDVYKVTQAGLDYKSLALDLGIKPDNTFTPLFSTSRLLFLVEGVDDVVALHHKALLYKEAGLIPSTFEELSINIIPIGGCGGVKHWVNLDLFTKLEKPFFIFLDSDKESADQESQNQLQLLNYGLLFGTDFIVTKKRLLENYIHPSALERLVPEATIAYTDFDHAKNYCKDYSDSTIRGKLGGAKVAERHYTSLTFDELRLTWFDGTEDEFVNLFNTITAKLN